MDAFHFDRWTRAFLHRCSRRSLAGALGLATFGIPGILEAKRGTARKRKIKRNAFGCVNAGKYCKNDRQCCSGICQGKKGKKQCKAHDTGGCQTGQFAGVCGADNVPCTTSAGQNGVCQTTTGNAGYCHGSGLACMPCSADTDCRALAGPDAACIRCGAMGCETACVAPQDWE